MLKVRIQMKTISMLFSSFFSSSKQFLRMPRLAKYSFNTLLSLSLYFISLFCFVLLCLVFTRDFGFSLFPVILYIRCWIAVVHSYKKQAIASVFQLNNDNTYCRDWVCVQIIAGGLFNETNRADKKESLFFEKLENTWGNQAICRAVERVAPWEDIRRSLLYNRNSVHVNFSQTNKQI